MLASTSLSASDAVRVIPQELVARWNQFRIERARLRQVHLRLAQTFWHVIPRRKMRCMPVIGWKLKPTIWEPEPVQGLVHTDGQPYLDKLGLTLRWRVSWLSFEGVESSCKAVPIWGFDYPSDKMPPLGMLIMGGITDEGDQANYHHYWNEITRVHRHYVDLGKWFEEMVAIDERWRLGSQQLEEYVGVRQDTMAADGTSEQSDGTCRRAS